MSYQPNDPKAIAATCKISSMILNSRKFQQREEELDDSTQAQNRADAFEKKLKSDKEEKKRRQRRRFVGAKAAAKGPAADVDEETSVEDGKQPAKFKLPPKQTREKENAVNAAAKRPPIDVTRAAPSKRAKKAPPSTSNKAIADVLATPLSELNLPDGVSYRANNIDPVSLLNTNSANKINEAKANSDAKINEENAKTNNEMKTTLLRSELGKVEKLDGVFFSEFLQQPVKVPAAATAGATAPDRPLVPIVRPSSSDIDWERVLSTEGDYVVAKSKNPRRFPGVDTFNDFLDDPSAPGCKYVASPNQVQLNDDGTVKYKTYACEACGDAVQIKLVKAVVNRKTVYLVYKHKENNTHGNGESIHSCI